MRFLVERFRLSDDAGRPVKPGGERSRSSEIVDGDDLEHAVSEYLRRDGFEMVGHPTSFTGSRALLTIRKGREVFAAHVHPITDESNLVPC